MIALGVDQQRARRGSLAPPPHGLCVGTGPLFCASELSPAIGDTRVSEPVGSDDRIGLLTHAEADAWFATIWIVRAWPGCLREATRRGSFI
jgi:hypothetical protein